MQSRAAASTLFVAVVAVVAGVGSSGCGKPCHNTRDCSLDELCAPSGVCEKAPPPAPTEGEGDGGEGDGGEGDVSGGEGEGEGDPAPARFDPDKIYVLGTFRDFEASSPSNIFELGDENHPSCCLPSSWNVFWYQMIRPSDGALLYIDGDDETAVIRKYAPDGFRYDQSDPFGSNTVFPTDEQARSNDQQVVACADPGTRGVNAFFVDPVTSEITYQCDYQLWFHEDGSAFTPPDQCDPRLGGAGGTLLCSNDSVADAQGAVHFVTGGGEGFDNGRARPDGGFWSLATGAEIKRQILSPNGTLTDDVVLAAPPSTVNLVNCECRGWAAIDGSGNGYRWMDHTDAVFADTIVKFTETSSSIVFDEASDPVTRIHLFELITGP